MNLSGVDQQSVEAFRGSDASGSDGAINRAITMANTTTSKDEIVIREGAVLHPTKDYTPNHKGASSTITFLTELFDEEYIRILYFK